MLKIHKLNPDAKVPVKTTDGAAGFDLYAQEAYKLEPGEWRNFKLGLAIEIPEGYFGQIVSRTGLAFQKKVTAFDGVIDSDFRGEFGVLLQNWSADSVTIEKNDRIAQLLIIPLHFARKMNEVETIQDTKRGSNGFGSTGK